jgi:uncharacterized protein (TIGR02147 family)
VAQPLDYTDYRKYLDAALDQAALTQRGARTRFSEFLGFKSGYISQIVKGQSDLSLEQAARANLFFGHTEEESRYFVLLVNHARAGSVELKSIFQGEIDELRERYLDLKTRFKTKDALSDDEKNIYFSSWQFAAVHIALTVPKLQTKDALVRHFKFEPRRISEILEFLVRVGFAKQKDGKYKPGTNWIHLGKDSPLATKNQINWRLRAIRAIEDQKDDELHYTSAFNVSEKDLFKVKAILVKTLEEIRAVIKDTNQETSCSLLLDLFEL